MGLQHLDTTIAFAVVMLLLSLLITVLVQIGVTAFGLRGKNLLWATERLIKQLHPDLAGDAKALAQKVLTHPALARAGDKLAVAMRKSELLLALDDLRAHPAGSQEGAPSTSPQDGLSDQAKERLDKLFERVVSPGAPELTAKAQELLEKLEQKFPDQAGELRTIVQETYGSTEAIVLKIDAWFDTVMDRASGRFTNWSRYWTVAFALIFGLVLQIDSLDILKQLFNDTALRNEVIALAKPTLEEAERIRGEIQSELARQAIEKVNAEQQLALVLPKPGDVPNEDAGAKWLGKALADPSKKEPALARYHALYQELAKGRIGALQSDVEVLRGHLEKTTLHVLPADWRSFTAYRRWQGVAGMLVTAAFLSLGAPFWFNTLRRLSDLRPIVARRAEGEEPKGAK